MPAVFAALIPVFLLIALGWGLKRAGGPGDGFWAAAERLTYYLFFPALLLGSLTESEPVGLDLAPLAAALIVPVLAVGMLVIALSRALGRDGPVLTSVFQGAVRFNTYIGIAAAEALYGAVGIALAAVCIAVLVPTVNLLSIAVLARYGARGGRAPGFVAQMGLIARNPLILACVAGAALNLLDLHLPFGVAPTIEVLGRAALPLGLLAVGAGLDLRALRATRWTVAAGTALKLLVLPLLAYAACVALDVPGPARAVAVLWAALPTAPSAYILARQLGGDATLMASLLTASTLGAFLTMPLMLGLLG